MILLQFCGAGEGIRILRSEPANDETPIFKPLGEIENPVSTTLARPQDDSGTFHRRLLEVNEHRLKRLERLAALDRSVRPALAAARALEAAYAHDDVASEAAMEDMARALSGAE